MQVGVRVRRLSVGLAHCTRERTAVRVAACSVVILMTSACVRPVSLRAIIAVISDTELTGLTHTHTQ